VVTKIPRFAFEKFPAADDRLTTQMKSVGEVMAMGRTIQESLQKALRGLEVGLCGLNPKSADKSLIRKANWPTPAPTAFGMWPMPLPPVSAWKRSTICAKIDRGFWCKSRHCARRAKSSSLQQPVKRFGLCRHLAPLETQRLCRPRLAQLLNISETAVRAHRYGLGVHPVYKRVDTCAAEFAIRHRLSVFHLRRRMRSEAV
jgi:carbamoyl-phosphate synthase large subunit